MLISAIFILRQVSPLVQPTHSVVQEYIVNSNPQVLPMPIPAGWATVRPCGKAHDPSAQGSMQQVGGSPAVILLEEAGALASAYLRKQPRTVVMQILAANWAAIAHSLWLVSPQRAGSHFEDLEGGF